MSHVQRVHDSLAYVCWHCGAPMTFAPAFKDGRLATLAECQKCLEPERARIPTLSAGGTNTRG